MPLKKKRWGKKGNHSAVGFQRRENAEEKTRFVFTIAETVAVTFYRSVNADLTKASD